MIDYPFSLSTYTIFTNPIISSQIKLLTTFFFSDETVPAVVHDAVDANQFHARITEMLHQLLRVSRAEIALLQLFLLSLGIIQSDKVLWQLLWFKRLCNGGPTNRTDCESLLLDFDEALLTEGVTTVQVSGNSIDVIEQFVA